VIFTKFGVGKESQVRTLTPNSTKWLTDPKSRKKVIYGINLPLRENDFYKIWRGEGVPGPHPHAKFHQVTYGPQIAKKGNLWYEFTPKGKSWAFTEKVEYKCTTLNLLLCNDTITVLKITLLHSVSGITNFVILKHDKKTSHFFVYSRRATHDPNHTWHGDRGQCHFLHPANFFWSDQ